MTNRNHIETPTLRDSQTLRTEAESREVAEAVQANDDDWTYTARRLTPDSDFWTVEVRDEEGEIVGHI